MKIINKIIIILFVFMIFLFQNIVYASMADYTDEEADKITKQNQEEWKQEQEERINKSSNNYLKSLSVEGYTLTPEFDKQIINYKIEENINEDFITINAETDDEKSSVSGDGKIELNVGENSLRVDVTAENGTVRTYFIEINTIGGKEKKEEKNDENIIEPEIENNIIQDQVEEQTQHNNPKVKYGIFIICSLIIITIAFFCIRNNNKKQGKHS